MKKLTIYTDGASKGNPGDAGIGVVITDEDGSLLCEIGEYIGNATNNVAEYSALIRGLEEALRLGAIAVELSTDSELMARQLAGVYKVKSPNIKPLFDKAVSLLRSFARITITHVVREYNKRADELANEGVKKHQNIVLNNGCAPKSGSEAEQKPEPPKKQASQGQLEF